ncbi:MAG: hypothetical protein MI924_08440 [Chloroflexales bacterium]|nr:hypothetical protein [Chloroflexales bacterium]
MPSSQRHAGGEAVGSTLLSAVASAGTGSSRVRSSAGWTARLVTMMVTVAAIPTVSGSGETSRSSARVGRTSWRGVIAGTGCGSGMGCAEPGNDRSSGVRMGGSNRTWASWARAGDATGQSGTSNATSTTNVKTQLRRRILFILSVQYTAPPHQGGIKVFQTIPNQADTALRCRITIREVLGNVAPDRHRHAAPAHRHTVLRPHRTDDSGDGGADDHHEVCGNTSQAQQSDARSAPRKRNHAWNSNVRTAQSHRVAGMN